MLHNYQLEDMLLISKPNLVGEYFAPFSVTAKGRLTMQQANVRSTKKFQDVNVELKMGDESMSMSEMTYVIYDEQEGTANISCCVALLDVIEKTFYPNMVGSFLVKLFKGRLMI